MVGIVLYFACPFFVASTEVSSWEDDSALLQIDVGNRAKLEMFKNIRSLLLKAQTAPRNKNLSLLSREELSRTIQPQIEQATNLIVQQKDSMKDSNTKVKVQAQWFTIVSIILDAIAIVYEVAMADKCALAQVILWWAIGMIAMTTEQENKVTAAGSVDMLVQQYTSVGYGSSTQNTTVEKFFHGFHGIVSQLAVGGALMEVSDVIIAKMESGFGNWAVNKYTASAILAVFTVLASIAFSIDLGVADSSSDYIVNGIYQALVTMTTIGYGDMSPSTVGGQWTTPITLPLLVSAFNRWKDAVSADNKDGSKDKDWKETVDKKITDMAFCNCGTMNLCESVTKMFDKKSEK